MRVRIVVLRAVRLLLWLFLAVILVRGAASFLLPPDAPVTQAAPAPPPAEPPPETDAPVAAATLFAREYLTWEFGKESDRAARLEPLWARRYDPQAGWEPAEKAASQTAAAAWPSAVKQLDPTHWLVTVAVSVVSRADSGPQYRVLYLTVPVLQEKGGCVVYDYPTLVPAPERAAGGEAWPPGDSMTDPDGQVMGLLTGFFRAYAAGDGRDLTYYLEPDLSVRGMGGTMLFRGIADLTLRRAGKEVWALALVRMEDPVTGTVIRQRYTLQVVERNGRWYIGQILQKGA